MRHSKLRQAVQAWRSGRLFRIAARLPAPTRSIEGSAPPPLERIAAEQLFSRIAGTSSVAGNSVHLLRDGRENYPAWLNAIERAEISVDFENYIIRDDDIGRQFASMLCRKASEGVPVRVLYDWLGCFSTPRSFWRLLREAGAEIRCFNRPRIDLPLGWLSRNHRKSLRCDDVGFVAGLCVGDMWVGGRGHAAWRDTGIEIRGPAVADMRAAFMQSWAQAGGNPPAVSIPTLGTIGPEPDIPSAGGPEVRHSGKISLRVIGSRPNTLGLYRFDQLIAGIARHTLWLTDAYFVGTTAYVQTLCDAARDGVDVRLLVPGASDIPIAQALSRAGYRPLLEAGCRVYEWDGPMLHAKTAVADGRWARIGSSNLNIASWIGNWELDVAVEDDGFAGQMQAMFLEDLEYATEIVLDLGRVQPVDDRPARRGSPGRLTAGAVGLGSAVGAAITNRRALGPAESKVMAAGGGILVVMATVAVLWPRVLTVPIAVAALWVALTLLVRAWRLRRHPH